MKPIWPYAIIAFALVVLRGLWAVTTRYTYGYNKGYAITRLDRWTGDQQVTDFGGAGGSLTTLPLPRPR
jgi:hypothetical protein